MNRLNVYLSIEGKTKSCRGDHASEFSVAVNRFTAPWPGIDFWIVVVKLELDVHTLNTFFFLFEQSLTADEIDVAV